MECSCSPSWQGSQDPCSCSSVAPMGVNDDESSDEQIVTRGDGYWEARLWLKGVFMRGSACPFRRQNGDGRLGFIQRPSREVLRNMYGLVHPVGARSGMWGAGVFEGGEEEVVRWLRGRRLCGLERARTRTLRTLSPRARGEKQRTEE